MVAQCYDLPALGCGYDAFVDRWQPLAEADRTRMQSDPLTARIVLTTDWLLMLRDDPRLPVALLPSAWPALPALALHRDAAAAAAPTGGARPLEVLTSRTA